MNNKIRVCGNVQNRTSLGVKPGIIINRMYAGDYLASNLGHEIINLFRADNGNHYLYLNASGNFSKEHEGIDTMLLVKAHSSDIFEVIGMAKGLHVVPGATMTMPRELGKKDANIISAQKEYIENEPGGIKYNGVSILNIFNDAEQQNIVITFKADSVFVPRSKRIFIAYNPNINNDADKNSVTVALHSHNMPRTSLKSYIYPDDNPNGSDYDNIHTNIVNNSDLWVPISENTTLSGVSTLKKRISLFDICQMRDDENRISNALAYFMNSEALKKVWVKFFSRLELNLSDRFTAEREVTAKLETAEQKFGITGGRIDILIKDDDNLIVIENKIKSDINSVKDDKAGTNQLHRYIHYANAISEGTGQTPHFFILAPNYNIPTIDEKAKQLYRIITYRDICDFLEESSNMAVVESDPNFVALYDVMKWHTFDTPNEYLYYEMLEKFSQRLKNSASSISRI